jgi:putative tryptophan/tyrosine transport system substrate-binding protein
MFTRVIAVVILALGAVLAPAKAQQPAKIPRVGFIYPGSKSLTLLFDIFRQRLADLGYVEGQNIIIEPRFADGQYERIPELAAELVGLKMDVIAVQGAVTVRAARCSLSNLKMGSR